MANIALTLDEIFDLAKKTLVANGCDDETASILADLIRNAERVESDHHRKMLLTLISLVDMCLLSW